MLYPVPSAPKYPIRRPPLLIKEVSAGGIVIDFESKEALVAIIQRTNRGGHKEWCLPKGHVENNENLEETSLREVAEETGISGEIIGFLGSIDYYFLVKKTKVHKTVHHFLMKKIGGFLTIENDPTCEVDDVRWISLYKLKSYLSFSSEKRMLDIAYKLYKGYR